MLNKLKQIFQKENAPKPRTHRAEDVGEFYDKYNDKFLAVYGEVIQAFRTHDVNKLLDYQIDAMGLKKGLKVLDAGCGVCGPACYFAEKTGVDVEAVTISKEQVAQAQAKITAKQLDKQVHVQEMDYHQLHKNFKFDTFDVVYFLESFGHSPNHIEAINSAWDVLKPGGLLYIKDLFKRLALHPSHQSKIDREVNKINTAYRYNIAELSPLLDSIRQKGWIVSAVKTIDLKLEEFENLTISNDFQELTGIAQIDNWDDYVFPVDFFELHLIKPHYQLEHGLDKYFLQNLMYMQVHGKREEDL